MAYYPFIIDNADNVISILQYSLGSNFETITWCNGKWVIPNYSQCGMYYTTDFVNFTWLNFGGSDSNYKLLGCTSNENYVFVFYGNYSSSATAVPNYNFYLAIIDMRNNNVSLKNMIYTPAVQTNYYPNNTRHHISLISQDEIWLAPYMTDYDVIYNITNDTFTRHAISVGDGEVCRRAFNNSLHMAYDGNGYVGKWTKSAFTRSGNGTRVQYGVCTTVYGNGIFLGIRITSPNEILISSDLVNWSASPFSTGTGTSYVGYGDGKFILITYSDNKVYTSTDGLTWTNIGVLTSRPYDFCYDTVYGFGDK